MNNVYAYAFLLAAKEWFGDIKSYKESILFLKNPRNFILEFENIFIGVDINNSTGALLNAKKIFKKFLWPFFNLFFCISAFFAVSTLVNKILPAYNYNIIPPSKDELEHVPLKALNWIRGVRTGEYKQISIFFILIAHLAVITTATLFFLNVKPFWRAVRFFIYLYSTMIIANTIVQIVPKIGLLFFSSESMDKLNGVLFASTFIIFPCVYYVWFFKSENFRWIKFLKAGLVLVIAIASFCGAFVVLYIILLNYLGVGPEPVPVNSVGQH